MLPYLSPNCYETCRHVLVALPWNSLFQSAKVYSCSAHTKTCLSQCVVFLAPAYFSITDSPHSSSLSMWQRGWKIWSSLLMPQLGLTLVRVSQFQFVGTSKAIINTALESQRRSHIQTRAVKETQRRVQEKMGKYSAGFATNGSTQLWNSLS